MRIYVFEFVAMILLHFQVYVDVLRTWLVEAKVNEEKFEGRSTERRTRMFAASPSRRNNFH